MSTELHAGALLGGRFRLDHLLGEGGMGVVWAATDADGAPVALKLLRRGLEDPRRRRRLLREARLGATLVHPNVRRVREILELDDGQPVLVMDLLVGTSLAEHLARVGRLAPAEAAAILLPVCAAVGAAHAQGIVHRDLKPANIFLADAPERRVLVLDFGIAKRAASPEGGESTSLTHSGAILGTPAYMSPEQAFGDADVDHLTDLWSLGIVLYEALSGVLPTRAPGLGQVLKLIVMKPIRPLAELAPDVPADLAALVDRLLSARREDRPESLREVAEVLARHAAVEAPRFGAPARVAAAPDSEAPPPRAPADVTVTGDTPPPRGAPVASGSRRRVAAAVAGAAAVAVAVAALLGAALRPRPHPPRADPPPAASPGCAANRDCGGEGVVCRRADGVCVTLASPDCAVFADPSAVADDATVWLGAMFPRTGEAGVGYGHFNVSALELGRRDFATVVGGIPSVREGGPTRPLGLVVCDDAKDPDRAARHLVDDVRVPAVIGFKSSREVIDLATTLFIPRRVPAIAAINHSALITGLPHPPGQPRYVLRVALGTRGRADAIGALVSGWIEPRLVAAGQVGPRRPLRVALIHEETATGVADVDGLTGALRFNGRAALENGEDFHDFVIAPGDAPAVATLVTRLVDYQPHVILSVGLGPRDVERLERRRRPGAPRFYLIWPGALPVAPGDPFFAFVAENEERRSHVLGVDLPTQLPANQRFVRAYNEAFEEKVGLGNSPGPSYDALYLAAYAAYASGEDPVTGEGLARAVARLVGPGPRVDVGPGKIVDALRLLHDGAVIDLAGTASNLDFDPATGESREDLAFLCVGRDGPGRPLEGLESGLVYDAGQRALRGALRCP